MIEQPSCPVCGIDSWELIAEQTYARSDSRLSPYAVRRYEVLFEIWAPGLDRLTIRYVLCKGCGFVIYTPRPTAEEVSAKYSRLGGASSSTATAPIVMPVDRRRSTEILELVSPYLQAKAKVLDFGGGTGSLMASFVERGYDCAVVDYAPEAIAGVERIAETIDSVPTDRLFDLIIASHVIEHVTDPVETVRSLVSHLAVDGHFYAEVPLELLGKAPLRNEPVTHINFFAEPSMRELLRRAGLETIRCWTTAMTSGGGCLVPAVCAVAKVSQVAHSKDDRKGGADRAASEEVRHMIRSGWAVRRAFLMRYPSKVLNPLRRLRTKYGW